MAVDLIAERIRALGEKAPGTYAEFSKLSKLKEGDDSLSGLAMAKDLHQSNVQIAKNLKAALTTAEKADDASTADLLTQRITTHDKAAWMLKSIAA